MRKHFLILMLLALLPLAGFAVTSIADATFTINKVSFSYTGAPITIGEGKQMVPTVTPNGASTALVYGTDYKLVFYDADQQSIEASNVKELGNYYVAAEGKGDYFGTTTTKVAFQIIPATVTVTITADIVKQYGDEAKPEVEFTSTGTPNVTVSGWLEGTTEERAARDAAIAASLDFAWGAAEKTANANYNGGWYDGTAKGHQLTWSANPYSANYTYKFVHEGGMKVTPVNLSTAAGANKLTMTADYTKVNTAGTAGGYLYNGATQVPNYTIKYKDPQNVQRTLEISTGTTGAAVKDFKVTYTWCATKDGVYSDDANANKNAGFYKATIVGEDKNYTGSVPFPKFDGNTDYYQIRQKGLYFGIADVNKIYDGVAFTEAGSNVNDVTIQPFGLVAVDNTTANLTSIAGAVKAQRTTASAPFDENVGSWEVEPTVTWSSLNDALKTNYFHANTQNMNGFMRIHPRPVVVTPIDVVDNIAWPLTDFATLVLQNSDNTAASYYTNYVTLEAKGENKGIALVGPGVMGYDETDYNTEVADILTGFKEALTEAHTTSGSWKGILAVVPKPTTGTGAYTGNYTIIAGENADYAIEGRSWAIAAKPVNLTYGQKVPENLEYVTVGLGGATFDDSGIKYIIKKVKTDDGTSTVVTVPENGRLDVLPATHHYEVSIDPVNSVIVAPADYKDPTIDENSVPLNVAKKDLFICPAEVAMNTGDSEANLNTLGLGDVKFLDSAAKTAGAYTGANALEEGDEISFQLVFKASIKDSNNKLTAIEDVNDGVQVALVTDAENPYFVPNNSNGNYNIDYATTAKLIVGSNVLTLVDNDAQMLDKIQIAASKTAQKYNVKFKFNTTSSANGRVLEAKKWNALVLPFDITIEQLSQEFGYAIVNVYDENSSDASTVRFKLEMDEVKANTPFIIKTAKEKKLKDITIHDVYIKDPVSLNPSKTVTGKVTMTGCYALTPITKDDYYFYNGAWNYGADSTTNPTNLPMSMAYWTPADSSNGVRVFVEDLNDDGTTAIKEVSAQTMKEIATDGWYTLNGVKLQGVPTEKGIYIQNGKKVVIK